METRLNLLCDAGVIDKDICKGMMQVVNVLETECHLPARSEQGTMAMTHMASALMRSRRGEEIEPLMTNCWRNWRNPATGKPLCNCIRYC